MTSTRSSKWVLFSALQREGRRMSVWLALFPFLGFLYALCHGLLQALMNQDTDTVARAGSDGAHFWQYSAVFVRRHNHGGGVLCHICFSLSVQSAAKRFLFIPAGDSAHFLLCQVGDRGIGAFAGLLRRRDRMLVVAAADSSQVACSTGCRLRPAAAGSCPLQRRRPSTVFVCYAPLRQARCGNTGPCLSVSAAVCPWD